MIRAACLALSIATGAAADCKPLSLVQAELGAGFGESVVAYGMSADGGKTSLMVLMANKETGTWTVLEGMPDGSACIRAAGEAFAIVTEKNGDPT